MTDDSRRGAMPGKLLVRVLERQRELLRHDFEGPVELGRQSDEREEMFTPQWQVVRDGPRKGQFWRVAVAPLRQDTVSRYHAFLEELDGGRVRLTNRSAKVPLRLHPADVDLAAGAQCELTLPAEFDLSTYRIQVQGPDREASVRSLETFLGGQSSGDSIRTLARFPTSLTADNSQLEDLLRWLQNTLEVLQSAVTETEFFLKAAQAVVDLISLDSGRVLLLENGSWTVAAVRTAPGVAVPAPWQPSATVLEEVAREKKTLWQVPALDAKSLRGVEQLV